MSVFPQSGPSVSNYSATSCPLATLSKTRRLFGFQSKAPSHWECISNSLRFSPWPGSCVPSLPYLNLASLHLSHQTPTPAIFLSVPPSSLPPGFKSACSPHLSDLGLQGHPLVNASRTPCPRPKAPSPDPCCRAQCCGTETQRKPQM